MNKEKLKNEVYYLWSFYKFQVIGFLVVVLVVLSFIIASMTKKENTLEVLLIDSYAQVSDEEMSKAYLESGLIDPKKWDNLTVGTLMFSGSESGTYAMNCLSRFMADINSGKLDVCAMAEEDYLKYDGSGSFLDLSTCLTEEEIASFEGHFLVTEDGRRIGIYTDAFPQLARWGCYQGDGNLGAIGIAYSSHHVEEAKQYLLEFMAE